MLAPRFAEAGYRRGGEILWRWNHSLKVYGMRFKMQRTRMGNRQ